jgi:ferredoxin-NADP reductase
MAIVDPGASGDRMWARESRFNRRAEVVAVDRLTVTGTVRIRARVTDGGPFDFKPGQFVAIQEDVRGVGLQHSPYCLFTPPAASPTFELLVRVFPEGPLSHWLASLPPGSPLHFRGPSGRSMLPKETGTELVLLATGVGISPFHSLLVHLLHTGDRRPIRLYWGLRLVDDICLTDDLDRLTAALPDFAYAISLSQPPAGWDGLRGRLTESVPPLLETLGGKRFYLSGNGAMCEEMEIALSDQGVDRSFLHQERFFNARHRADQATIDAMLARFVATDLFSPHAEQQAPLLFAIERDVHGRKIGPP